MIKVAVWGTGMMGQGLLGFILDRPKDVELVGAIVTNPAKEGVTVGELLGRPCDVPMTTDFDAVLAEKPDVVCICTQSFLHEITDQVEPCVQAGCNVICIAEKLAYPWASDPEWAERFDALAKEHGVSILGTGINPGFILDALIVMWTSICLRVDRIEAQRVNDLSPFGPTVMQHAGRRHDRRGVRARRRRRHASSATSASPSRSTSSARRSAGRSTASRRRASPSSRASSARRRTSRWRPATSPAAGRSAAATSATSSRSSSSTRSRSTPRWRASTPATTSASSATPRSTWPRARDSRRQGHVREHGQLHPAHRRRARRHRDRRRPAAAALLGADRVR